MLVLAGSRSTAGAAILSGESALRSEAGKLQVATARSVAAQVCLALPEAMVRGFPEGDDGNVAATAGDDVFTMADGADSVLLGPGMSDPHGSTALLDGIVPRLSTTVVIDALGSAYVTEHPDGLHHLDGRCVLTLNPDEIANTLGVEPDEVTDDLGGAALDLARRSRAVVLGGGSEKVVATPDGAVYLVHEGGPGLGVSGSGDVQSGVVAGLVARGAEPAQAAVWGASLHGRAGDRLASEVGAVGFLARELPGVVPGLLRELSG